MVCESRASAVDDARLQIRSGNPGVSFASLVADLVDLGSLGEARFRDLVADCGERILVVVRFLALLELHREGRIELSQAETFGEIEVRWHPEGSQS